MERWFLGTPQQVEKNSSCKVAKYTFKQNPGSPPSNAMRLGYQYDDAGRLYLGVANTQWELSLARLRMGPAGTRMGEKSIRQVTSLGHAQILIRTTCMLTMDLVLQSMDWKQVDRQTEPENCTQPWQSLIREKSLARLRKILAGTPMVEKNITQANSTGLWWSLKDNDQSILLLQYT